MSVGVNVATRFVKAKTAEMLTRKMRKIQLKRGTMVPFFDIQFAEGFWYAWFQEEISLMGITKEETKEE